MVKTLEKLFWFFLGTVIYTFLGYPILVTILTRIRERPVAQANITPEVTLLIPAYNEEQVIPDKIENSLKLDYPADQLHIVVVADGSDDGTVEIANGYETVSVYAIPDRRGKAAAVNRVVPFLKGEIIVITDANAMLDRGSLRAIARNFADPEVAGVAGEKRVLGGGEGLYWRYESYLKRCDSKLSSVMGACGELFAFRKGVFQATAEDAIIEDFVFSMRVVGEGWRVVYEPEAIASELPALSIAADWERRTRIAAGGFQAIVRLPQLLDPRKGRVAWQYISHRVLRWAITPFLLPSLLIINFLLMSKRIYRLLFVGQIVFYASGLLGYIGLSKERRIGIFYAIFYFCLANLAALAGFWRYVTGRQSVTWQKVRH